MSNMSQNGLKPVPKHSFGLSRNPCPETGGIIYPPVISGRPGVFGEQPKAREFQDTQEMPTLPALAGLSRLRDLRPVVVVDSREQLPLRFSRLTSIPGTLQSGDYSAAGLEHVVAIERKSAADLVASVTHERERFERELHRLRGFNFARVVVTAPRADIEAGLFRSKASPKAVLSSCAAFEVRYGVPFVFVANDAEAAAQVESWLWLVAREVVESANRLLRGTESAAPTPEAA